MVNNIRSGVPPSLSKSGKKEEKTVIKKINGRNIGCNKDKYAIIPHHTNPVSIPKAKWPLKPAIIYSVTHVAPSMSMALELLISSKGKPEPSFKFQS